MSESDTVVGVTTFDLRFHSISYWFYNYPQFAVDKTKAQRSRLAPDHKASEWQRSVSEPNRMSINRELAS